MASVQELILAAQAKQKQHPLSMLAQLISAGAEGYSKGSTIGNVRSETDLRRAQVTKILMEKEDKDRMEREYLRDQQAAAERNRLQEQLSVTAEQNLRTGQAGVAATPAAPTPSGKFKEWSRNEKGELSWKEKQVDPTVTPYQSQSLELQRQRLDLDREKLSRQQTEEAKIKSRNRAKLEAERPKAKASLDNTMREFDNMIAEAEAIKNDPGLEMATGASSFMGKLPGGLSLGAKNPRARLDTLKAKTLLNVLSSLKELSATGASGFGALSNIEGENLRNSVSTLDTGLETPDFKASLDRFIKEMRTRKKVFLGTFQETYVGENEVEAPVGSGLTPEEEAELLELEQKYGGGK